jgi:hypothetical protein
MVFRKHLFPDHRKGKFAALVAPVTARGGVEEHTPGGLGSAESAYATELGIEAPKSGVPRPKRPPKLPRSNHHRLRAPRHRRRVFPQSSKSRCTAGCDGFLNLSQSRERPET